MKRFLLLSTLSLFLFACEQKEVAFSQLQERDGLLYEINQEKPFTGIAFEKYENEQFFKRFEYKNGELHGLAETWHENGQLSITENYTEGIPIADFAMYTASGIVMAEGTLTDNTVTYIEYRDEGIIKKEFYLKGNYTSNRIGSYEYEKDNLTEYEGSYYGSEGQLRSHELLEDGYATSKMWHDNEQLAYEYTYVDGKPSGTWTNYTAEGNVSKIVSYNELGELDGMSVEFSRNYPNDTSSYILYSNGEKLEEAFYLEKESGGCVQRKASFVDGGVLGDWQFWNRDCSERPYLSELVGKWQSVSSSMTYSYLTLYANGSFTTESKNLSGYSSNGNGAFRAYYEKDKRAQVFSRTTYYSNKNKTAVYKIGHHSKDKLILYALTSGYSNLEYIRVE